MMAGCCFSDLLSNRVWSGLGAGSFVFIRIFIGWLGRPQGGLGGAILGFMTAFSRNEYKGFGFSLLDGPRVARGLPVWCVLVSWTRRFSGVFHPLPLAQSDRWDLVEDDEESLLYTA